MEVSVVIILWNQVQIGWFLDIWHELTWNWQYLWIYFSIQLFFFLNDLYTNSKYYTYYRIDVQSCWQVTWDESRVESRVMRVESSHESLRSVLESSQVTSHRGLESSRVTQSCRVMPESYKINKLETGPDALCLHWKVNLKLKYLYLLYT